MRLDTVGQRHKFIKSMVKKSFEIDEMFVHDDENVDDWVSNSEILKNLISLEKMILTEKILLYTLEDMEDFPSNSAEKKILISIAEGGLHYYIESVLMHMLEYSCDYMNEWKFKTTVGKRFHRITNRKLNELTNKYREIYGFATEPPDEKIIQLKFDTSQERLETVQKFLRRAMKINDAFVDNPQISFGDVLGLTALTEKITALEDAINTEIYFENALNEMMDVRGENSETRQKFFTPFAQQSEQFMKDILFKRIELIISFSNNNYHDEQLVQFQTDLCNAMVDLRKKYAEIYNI